MEDFIECFGITQHKLAVAIGVPPRRINEIVHGKRGITADTAMRLSRYFGTTPGFWMNLQMRYELDRAEDALGGCAERNRSPCDGGGCLNFLDLTRRWPGRAGAWPGFVVGAVLSPVFCPKPQSTSLKITENGLIWAKWTAV